MKSIFTLLSVLLLYISTQAATKFVISDNDQGGSKGWQNPANWLPAGVPQSGDLVIIPPGKTITVKGNVYPTAALLTLFIEGTLDFDPSGKLNLQSGSLIQLVSSLAKITCNGASSEQIIIGGGIKYNGQNDGTVVGPSFANAASPNSTSATPGAGFYIGVLPVQVDGFAAQHKDGRVLLSWTTQLENATKTFEVQRSTNMRDWTTVSTLSAKSTCHCITQYTAVDKSPLRATSYYRLMTTDRDGKAEYSAVTFVQVNDISSSSINYSINGAGSLLALQVTGANFTFPLNAQLISINGGLTKKQVVTSTPVYIDISALGKGLAVLLIDDQKGRSWTMKVVK